LGQPRFRDINFAKQEKHPSIQTECNRLLSKIEALHIPYEKSPVSSYVTVSIGVAAMIPNTSSSHDDLFKSADKSLYQAKTADINQAQL